MTFCHRFSTTLSLRDFCPDALTGGKVGSLQHVYCSRQLIYEACLKHQRAPSHTCSRSRAVATHARQDSSAQSQQALGSDALLSLLRSKQNGAQQGPGEVFLVGTGPGDPGLLTLRAVQLMQTADVVLYDRLVSDDILHLVHGGARMVYVGKQAGFHTRSQDEIHELLCQFASEGASVLRLKGGDPYIFGRGGEEVQYLQDHGIRAHCIPGITAASGICAELGIPLTHRGIATSVRFLTGHAQEGGEGQLDTTIAASFDPHTTLVVYMGLGNLPNLTQRLIAAGLSADTPAVAVERGTTPQQRVVHACMGDLHAATQKHQLKSPTLIVIGDVVALSLGWRAFQQQNIDFVGPKAAACDKAKAVAVFEQQRQLH